MNARTDILQRIRTALAPHGPLQHDPQRLDALRARIAGPRPHLRPVFDEPVLDRFMRRVREAAMTLDRVAQRDAVPAAALRHMQQLGLPARLCVAPALADLAWDALDIEGQPLTWQAGAADRNTPTAITPCVAGLAETGTLVLASGSDAPTTLNFVPDDHLIVIHADQVVMHLEDGFAALRERYLGQDAGRWPRTVNLISGPSRTADVDQVVQIGVHGPRRVHVILVG